MFLKNILNWEERKKEKTYTRLTVYVEYICKRFCNCSVGDVTIIITLKYYCRLMQFMTH